MSLALITSSRSPWVCRWIIQVFGGAGMYLTGLGWRGSRTSITLNPLENMWPTKA